MDSRIQASVSMIEAHLYRDLSLEEMARSVNLLTSRFRHLFKAETSVSPLQYVASLRMRRAKELIETTPLSIKQVRHAIGVRDKKHFSARFKKTYGLAPKEYKTRYAGNVFAPGASAQAPATTSATR